MLPSAHVEFTWAAANALQRSPLGRRWQNLDYRLLALAAILPDLIDKPLAIFALPDSHAALLYGHTLLLHLAVWGGTAATKRVRRWLPYLLAFSGHLVADRMWGFGDTLLWPLRGLRFHQWKDIGSPGAFLKAYGDIIRNEPKLVAFEAVGLVLLAWVIADRRLYRKRALGRFLRTGRVEIRDSVPDTSPASHQMGRGQTPMAADIGDNWAKKEEEHPCLSVFIRVLAKVSGR